MSSNLGNLGVEGSNSLILKSHFRGVYEWRDPRDNQGRIEKDRFGKMSGHLRYNVESHFVAQKDDNDFSGISAIRVWILRK